MLFFRWQMFYSSSKLQYLKITLMKMVSLYLFLLLFLTFPSKVSVSPQGEVMVMCMAGCGVSASLGQNKYVLEDEEPMQVQTSLECNRYGMIQIGCL